MPITNDITGQRFGSLVVIERDERPGGRNGVYWVCRCDCGNLKTAAAGSLRSGKIKSCGCRVKNKHRNEIPPCPYNAGVDCAGGNCDKCRWRT